MADQEVSKVMWIAIVVALASSIYFIARPQINTLANTAFDKIGEVVKGTDTGDNGNGGNVTPPEDKGTLVNPDGALSAQTSAPGAADASVALLSSVNDSKGNIVNVTAIIKNDSGTESKNGELKAGEYTVEYSASGYDKPATQKLTVTDPTVDPGEHADLIAPENKTLTTPGFKQSVDGAVSDTLKDSKGVDVKVNVSIQGDGTVNPKALTKGNYTVTYSAEGYDSVTSTISVTDKMVTPSGFKNDVVQGGKFSTQTLSGKGAPNSKVEIKYGYPNGSAQGGITYLTTIVNVDSSGNFTYTLGQYEAPDNIRKMSARSIYEYSATDKQMSGWSAESTVYN